MNFRYILVILFGISQTNGQFFDFLQGLQPYFQSTTTISPASYQFDQTTKRHRTSSHKKENSNENTSKRNKNKHSPVSAEENNVKKTTAGYIISVDYVSTSPKPRKSTKGTSSHAYINIDNINDRFNVIKNNNRNTEVPNDRNHFDILANNYNGNNNFNYNYYTTKPNIQFQTTTRRRLDNNDYRPDNQYQRPYDNERTTKRPTYNQYPSFEHIGNPIYERTTTEPTYFPNDYTVRPVYSRPGVKPTFIDNRPPITNRPTYKPTTKRPVTQRPDPDAVAFPDADSKGPPLIIGPDEDKMTAAEKRRYIELAERVCDKYKAKDMTQLEAIPLLPSPEPVTVNVSKCIPTSVPLVVGGKVVTIDQFPHMALLGWQKLRGGGYSWKCGGSLISDQFILTAAHCAYQERDNTVVSGTPQAAQLGSSYLDDDGAIVVKIAEVHRHAKYSPPRSYYDLAVVKLVKPVTFSSVIKPACLGVPPAVGKHIVATGWGRTEFGGEQSKELRSVSLPVWSMDRCARVLGTSRKLPDGPSAASQMCAGDERGGKDTCQGDSGGPAQVEDGCVWRVTAVTSLGRACGAVNTPGLYATVQRAFVATVAFKDFKFDDNGRQNVNRDTTRRPSNQNSYNQGGNSYNQGGNSYNQGGNSYNQGGNSYNQGGNSYNQGGNSYNQGGNSNNQDRNNHDRNQNSFNSRDVNIFDIPSSNQGMTTRSPNRNTDNGNYRRNDNNFFNSYSTQPPNYNNYQRPVYKPNNYYHDSRYLWTK